MYLTRVEGGAVNTPGQRQYNKDAMPSVLSVNQTPPSSPENDHRRETLPRLLSVSASPALPALSSLPGEEDSITHQLSPEPLQKPSQDWQCLWLPVAGLEGLYVC